MGTPRAPGGDGRGPEGYAIRLGGHLDARWAAWFDGLRVSREPDGTTVISGTVMDQAALHGVLRKVRDLGLPLISVSSVSYLEPDAPAAPAGEPR